MRRLLPLCLFLLLTVCPSLTRAEQVVFSELMYNPAPGKPEFIEIWNITHTPLDMEKWRFTDGVNYTFPAYDPSAGDAFLLKPQERVLVCGVSPAELRAAYPSIPETVRIFGPWSGSLNNAGETVTLRDKNGAFLCTVSYKPNRRWPVAADGTGHSLVLVNENRKIDDDRNWRASGLNGGSPGLPESGAGMAAGRLVLNEARFNQEGALEFVEVKNINSEALATDGLFVSARPDFLDKFPLSGIVASGGYAGFATAFPAGGEVLYLLDSANNVIHAAEVSFKPGLPVWQAWPEDGKEWYAGTTGTPGAPNNPARETRIVLNEIMYDPPSKHRDGEFIELYNKSSESVSLSGWRIRGEVDFTFPPGTTLGPKGYLVVAANAAWLNANYEGLTAIGDYSGKLANGGGRLRLEDANGNLADEVYYMPGGDWPHLAAGKGSSMELIHPDMDNSLPSAWRDSDETNKSVMRPFSVSGQWRNWRVIGAASNYKELNVFLTGEGEVVLENIMVQKDGTGPNLLRNGDRMAPSRANGNPLSDSGWLARGRHWQSHFDDQGRLHIISEGHGENKGSLAECDLSPLNPNDFITISFQARWISGRSRLIVQTFDQSVGKDFEIPIPNNLGTPGAPNSRALPAPLPQVDGLIHSPAVPKPNQPVTVTARVTSATPLSSVSLKHRLDNINNNGTWNTVPMNDSGVDGDAVAGDGVWSARITYPTNGNIAQFYVEAVAQDGGVATRPKLGPEEPAMFIVDAQSVPKDRRVQRLIISAYWRDALRSNSAGTVGGGSAKFDHKFPKLSAHYFPAVFIHNESEIYYGAGMRKGGSPWTRPEDNDPNSGLSRGAWTLPEDRIFRGQTKRGWDNEAAASNGLHNRLVRYWLYLLGEPYNTGEFVRHIINNSSPAFREDVEPDNNDLLDRSFDDGSDGELYAVEDGWWIQDFNDIDRLYQDADWDYNQTTKNSDEPIRWHNEYAKRTREQEYDYASLTSLIQMIDRNNFTRTELESMMNIRSVAAYQAVRGYAGDWDSFLMNRGKNCFLYRPPGGTFRFLHWDSDLAFQNTSEVFLGSGRNIQNVMNKGYVRRQLIHYLNELLANYSNSDGTAGGLSPRLNAWLDAEKAAFPNSAWSKTFYTNWCRSRFNGARAFINQSVGGGSGAYAAPFALTNPPSTTEEAVLNLTGTAPALAASVAIDGHPEATMEWVDGKTFSITGIQLREGVNSLTLRMLAEDGSTLGAPLTHNVTKTGNAPPVVSLTCSAPSFRAALGEIVTLDASASYDPEAAGTLTFDWVVAPATGFTMSQPSASMRSLQFSVPGVYRVTLTLTDAAGKTTVTTRDLIVYNTAESTSFDTPLLPPFLTATGVGLRSNYSPSGWYSLEDTPGRLQLKVGSDAPHPLNSGDHPRLLRPLPAETDWTLQTSTRFETRATGAFQTGLYVEITENGAPVRYAFGADGGSALTARRSVNGGPFTGPVVAVRINCGGGDTQEFTNNVLWLSDRYFTGGSTVTQHYTPTVNGLVNDSARVAPDGFSYAIPLANGTYDVKLHASTGEGAVTQRVTLNGSSQTWEVANGLTSTEKVLTVSGVTITNETLNLQIARLSGANPNAVLTGIEILPAGGGAALENVEFTALRARRTGGQLVFSRQTLPGVWIDVATFPLPPGAEAVSGGVFASTDAAQTLRVSFDYLLLADPASSSAPLSDLRLTEIMYHHATSDVEFLELRNFGDQPLDISGAGFDDGRPFDAWTFPPGTVLAPGEYIVVTNNVATFQALYGAGPRLAGAWPGGALNNAGERIVLRDAQGNVIHDFTYDDSPPWPVEADGGGPSLEVIDVYGDYNDPANWRAGAAGGSPGTGGAPPPSQDSDGDGVPDDVEALFGTDPHSSGSRPHMTAAIGAQGEVSLSWPAVPGGTYRVERSVDLQTWVPVQTIVAEAALATWTDIATGGEKALFYRVAALP